MGTNLSFWKELPIFATSNTCVSDLQIKLGRETVSVYFGTTKLRENNQILFLRFNLSRKYISGERSKEMHVHISDKTNENISRHVELKHVGA